MKRFAVHSLAAFSRKNINCAISCLGFNSFYPGILGEDKLSLLLTNTTSLTPASALPGEESARRKAVQKTSILLKVRFNGKEVFSTDPRPLSTDFKLHFGLIFRIRIVQWPESLKVCKIFKTILACFLVFIVASFTVIALSLRGNS